MTEKPKAGILGIGSYLPERRITNADLERMVDTSDEWIVQRTGIRERRIAAEGESTSDMALKASMGALRDAGLTAQDLDLIVVATCTPDTLTPSTACWLQGKLAAGPIAAFDLSAACSGFLYGLSLCKAYVETGAYRRILLVGAEKLSAFTDWTDRGTCILFGDAAGAVVIGPTGGKGEILSTHLAANGGDADLLNIPAGGARLPASPETVAQRKHTLQMQGREVFKIAVRVMADAAAESLRKAGLGVAEVDWLVPHQANLRIIATTAERLGIPMEKVYLNVERTGNTSAASIIVALDEAVASGAIRRGQVLCMAAFGAGTTVASAVVRW